MRLWVFGEEDGVDVPDRGEIEAFEVGVEPDAEEKLKSTSKGLSVEPSGGLIVERVDVWLKELGEVKSVEMPQVESPMTVLVDSDKVVDADVANVENVASEILVGRMDSLVLEDVVNALSNEPVD